MALIPYNSVLDVIHARVTSAAHLRPGALPVEVGGETVHLDLPQARAALYEQPVDEALRNEVWRGAVALAQHDALAAAIGSTEVTGWVEAVVWLALPHLGRIARQASARLGADRRDVESEVTLAIVERLAEVSADDPDVGMDLLRTAGRRGWEFARRSASGGQPVEDIVAVADARTAESAEDFWELTITPPDRVDGLAAPLRLTSRSTVEGARLSELADHLGLREVVHRAHRPHRGPRLGSLSLRSAGVGR
ncbi:hypothetical protein P3T27_005314 [Kitasatospora sp. MAA19]|uniref:hypothetical protein n=1 Tax=Kitasatospora sp. MAA19 TaxID=3035090 RepID=UPI0024758EE3|nr:hypothetical protein [Kitasatospora sp. MAA19]MDH6708574.1 hypothetical protein [Kitasatospora sp. MAA19]